MYRIAEVHDYGFVLEKYSQDVMNDIIWYNIKYNVITSGYDPVHIKVNGIVTNTVIDIVSSGCMSIVYTKEKLPCNINKNFKVSFEEFAITMSSLIVDTGFYIILEE